MFPNLNLSAFVALMRLDVTAMHSESAADSEFTSLI